MIYVCHYKQWNADRHLSALHQKRAATTDFTLKNKALVLSLLSVPSVPFLHCTGFRNGKFPVSKVLWHSPDGSFIIKALKIDMIKLYLKMTNSIIALHNLEWAHKQFIATVHTLLYSLHDMMSPYMTMKRRFSHIDIVPYLNCSRSTDYVATDCAMPVITWELTWQLWHAPVKNYIKLVRYRFYSLQYSGSMKCFIWNYDFME